MEDSEDIEIVFVEYKERPRRRKKKRRKYIDVMDVDSRKIKLWHKQVVYFIPPGEPYRTLSRKCIECNSPLIATYYLGTTHVIEIVCTKCGLVHAVYGSNFYQKETEKIKEELRRKYFR